jgi:hypothetical protein
MFLCVSTSHMTSLSPNFLTAKWDILSHFVGALIQGRVCIITFLNHIYSPVHMKRKKLL